MVIRGADNNLYWQDLDTGVVTPYTGQDGANTTAAPASDTTAATDTNGSGVTDTTANDSTLAAAAGRTGSLGGGPPDTNQFDPSKHAITGVTKLPGGTQYRYTDQNGVPQVAFIPETAASGGAGVSAATQANIAAKDAALAQNQQQFQSNQDMERAKFNENYALDQGKELLGLGSHPDTLIKYLYALRGQQVPQALNGTTTNLPGFQNVVGQPNPQPVAPAPASATTPAAASAPAPTPVPAPALGANAPAGTSLIPNTPYVGAGGTGIPTPSLTTGGMTIPGTTMTQGRSSTFNNAGQVAQALAPGISIGMGNGTGPGATAPLHIGGNTAVPAGVTEDPSFQAFRQSVANNIINNQVSPAQQAAGPTAIGPGGIAIYKHGGLIPEPVMGIGLHSGQKYLFGEAGPEHVTPGAGKQPAPPTHGTNAYAAGGTIGYDPSTPPISPGVFNPPDLSGIVARGYNSSPNTPLFPQIGIATNGGQSLIPSAQRYNSLLPSEQSLYQGALQDEFGVNPTDTLKLSQSLMPQVSGLRTPRFAN